MDYGETYSIIKKAGKKIVTQLPDAKIGDWKISHRIATEEDVKTQKLKAAMNGMYGEYAVFEPGNYVILSLNGYTIMSNTDMEIRTNIEVVQKAKGNVLIGGLGIGLIVLPIMNKKEVKKVTVIEKSKEVIELVKLHLPFNDKVNIINGDINEWCPDNNNKFDVVYFDIWEDVCTDNYEEMKTLMKKFRKYMLKKKEDRWIDCWRREDTKRLVYEDRFGY